MQAYKFQNNSSHNTQIMKTTVTKDGNLLRILFIQLTFLLVITRLLMIKTQTCLVDKRATADFFYDVILAY